MPKSKRNDLRNSAKEEHDELPVDPARKFAWVESQIHRITLGQGESIGCPYCLSFITAGVDRLCSASMGEAVAIILQNAERDRVLMANGFGGFAMGLKSIAETDKTNDSSGRDNTSQSIQ